MDIPPLITHFILIKWEMCYKYGMVIHRSLSLLLSCRVTCNMLFSLYIWLPSLVVLWGFGFTQKKVQDARLVMFYNYSLIFFLVNNVLFIVNILWDKIAGPSICFKKGKYSPTTSNKYTKLSFDLKRYFLFNNYKNITFFISISKNNLNYRDWIGEV